MIETNAEALRGVTKATARFERWREINTALVHRLGINPPEGRELQKLQAHWRFTYSARLIAFRKMGEVPLRG